MPEKLKYHNLLLSSIKSDPNNPRQHTPENLASIRRSISEYGQYRPIIVNAETNVIIAGHGIFQVMCELGWKYATCVLLSVSREQAGKIGITDNRTAELADWDAPKLCRQLNAADRLEGFGFDEADLAGMMRQLDKGRKEGEAAKEVVEARTIVCPKCAFHFTKKVKKSGCNKNTAKQTSS